MAFHLHFEYSLHMNEEGIPAFSKRVVFSLLLLVKVSLSLVVERW